MLMGLRWVDFKGSVITFIWREQETTCNTPDQERTIISPSSAV
ncbi:unnamed protein product, partial [Timema podura]|nr:unnamed protein product [Timema podura]